MTDLLLRPATAADAERVFAWANDPVTRAASFTSAPIPWDTHRAWFAASLANPERHLLIAEDPEVRATTPAADAACAFLRLDLADAQDRGDAVAPDTPAAVISINVAPAARGQGVGRRALAAASATAQRLGFRAVIAWIRPRNQASVRAFTAVGYAPAGQDAMAGEPALRFVCSLPVTPAGPRA